MKHLMMAAALMALGTTALHAQTPQPADWTILTFTADSNKPADITWDRIGGHDWCGIAKFLDLKSCAIMSGKGELGSLRMVEVGPNKIVEMAVARTPLSYTYAQPFTPIFYHGTMAVEPVGATHSRIVYTLIWNQTAVGDKKAQTDAHDSRQRRFRIAVDKMAAAANAP